MNYPCLKCSRILVLLGCATALSGCGGDDPNESTGPDPARVEVAPDSTKSLCEQVCTAADEIRSKACGTTEFATHSRCYAECVVRYLDYPECQEDFDQSNECVRDAGCSAQSQCMGDIIMAAACMQVSPAPG